jgi:hypothetical protein
LSTKITFSLDEINVLGSQANVAMALQQFSQVDLLLYEKREKEVTSLLFRGCYLLPCSATCGQTMIQQGLSQNYKYATSAVHIYPVSTTTDVSQTISLEK